MYQIIYCCKINEAIIKSRENRDILEKLSLQNKLQEKGEGIDVWL